MNLANYLKKQLKERNGSEGLELKGLISKMTKKGFDLDKEHTEYEDITDIIYKEITSMMIERNVNERQEVGTLTIEDVYPIVRESVSFHGKALAQNGLEEEDIVQNVMIKAYNNWDKFRGESRIATWVFRIVKNEVINMLIYQNRLKRRPSVTVSIEYETFDFEDKDSFVLDNIIADETLSQVVGYISDIQDQTEKEIVGLFLTDIPNKEISKELGVPVVVIAEVIKKHGKNIRQLVEA